MTPDEVVEVWDIYLRTRDSNAEAALFQQYLPLARYLARRSLAKAPAFQDPEEILSYAHRGLLDAVRRFEKDAGAKFETYATRRIAGAIVDGQRQQDPLARGARRRVKLLEQASARLFERLDREPTLTELAVELGEPVEAVRMAQLDQKSLNGSLDVDNGVADSRALDSEAETSAELHELRGRVAERLSYLSPRERSFLLAYYCANTSVKDAGIALGQSNDWCRSIRSQLLSGLACSC